ncbi:hypothetical protein FOA52_011175 [Chlamydomonas sp. UWO 241]|nr:hypothetical protein FOA52_011175 [Chlamydomonas sp. UWO 241]
MEEYHSVVVIGAGAAGLYAAQLLRGRYPDVVVVEAQPRIGGRIKQEHGLTPWAVQSGPEFVHGSNSILVEVMKEAGFGFEERAWPDFWYFPNGDKKLMHDDDVDAEVDKVHDMFDSVGDLPHPAPGKDVSALEWMRQQGATPRQVAVADACYANDFACSLSQLGLRELVEENRRWDSGESYLIADGSMCKLVGHLSQGLNIRTSWPVSRVEYGGPAAGVRLACADGRAMRARAVVVTVPLKQLQAGVITFAPELPPAKAAAISRIQMGNVVKVFLTFKEQFWPKDMYDVICPECFVPEFWMVRYPETAPGTGHPHLITGFLAGERADRASQLPEPEAVSSFLSQLDTMFATPGNPTPATSSLGASRVVDWSKEKYVGGAYTYPTLGAELGDRAALAAPVSGTVFFAGEASSLALNPCIQGALETGQRAAAEVAASLEASSQRSRI